MSTSDEQLRETLIDLARAREREVAQRKESEAVLAGLRVIATAESPGELFAELLEVLRGVVGFDEALVALPRPEGLVVVATTRAELKGQRLCLDQTLPRASLRGPLPLFDMGRVPELRFLDDLGQSALITPLEVDGGLGCLVMVHGQRGFFHRRHTAILRRLAPLLGQAVRASTQREQRQHAERESLARFPAEDPRPIVRGTASGELLYANPSAQTLLQDLPVESGSLPLAWTGWMARSLGTGSGFSVSHEAGGRHWSVTVAPFPEEGYANAYFADITPLRQAEQALQRSNSRILALVSQQYSAVLLEDDVRKVVLANQAFCDLFEIPVPPEVLEGSDCAQAATESAGFFAEPAAFLTGVDQILADGRPRLAETLRLADGRVVERDYLPITIDGRPGGHLWQYRDVTERHRASERLEEAKREAEQANEAKSDFLARMSHEIRTPLNAMIGMTELLLDSSLSDEQRSWLRGAHSNSRALLFLINDILDLSRVEAGTVTLDRASLDPIEVVEDVVDGFSTRAVERGVELWCEVGKGVPAAVLGDANRLRQVLANLLGNALKYTDRGEVGVSLDLRGDGRLCVEVRDTGTGIAPEELDRIFERYTQAQTGARPGTGLGLYITRQLVDLMGGELTVDSTLGVGSTFRVWVPVEVLRGPAELDPALRGALVGLRVHLAMAAGPGRSRLEAMLAGLGVERHAKAPETVDEVDLSVVDDGEEPDLARRLLALGPVVHLAPVVGSLLAESLGGSGSPRVVKPIRRLELLAALARAVGRGEPQQEESRANPRRSSPSLRVLVVDDNADNRAVARGYLEGAGHVVLAASGGEQGLELACSERLDAVLMDLHMPRTDGLEATRLLREWEAEEGRARVPVLAFTAHATPRMRQQALAAGMDDFLVKPIKRQAMLAALERAVGHKKRVLVVDDASDMRRLVGHFLRKAELEVVEATDGLEVEAALEAHDPDLLLMDVEMPGRSGPDTVAVLRSQGVRLPIIALTGHSEPAVHERLKVVGYDAVAVKPVRRKTLVALVREWLLEG